MFVSEQKCVHFNGPYNLRGMGQSRSEWREVKDDVKARGSMQTWFQFWRKGFLSSSASQYFFFALMRISSEPIFSSKGSSDIQSQSNVSASLHNAKAQLVFI